MLELKKTFKTKSHKVGCSLLPARNALGDMFVCQITMFTLPGDDGQDYCALIHEDVSTECSLQHLLEIVGTGDYVKLLRTMRMEVNTPDHIIKSARSMIQLILQEGVVPREEPNPNNPHLEAVSSNLRRVCGVEQQKLKKDEL
mmetsp:Transcript_7774/g.8479  ORF Transcript_7774/g.8479 Transcript_7774/m.8479 type:complete len:143 (+) Transcript_7774:192-620(+)